MAASIMPSFRAARRQPPLRALAVPWSYLVHEARGILEEAGGGVGTGQVKGKCWGGYS